MEADNLITSDDNKAISLRLSVTDRCQMRCSYCIPETAKPLVNRDEVLSYEELIDFVRALRKLVDIPKIRLTGGEPLLRRDINKLIGKLSSEGIPELTLTTNGQLLSDRAQGLAEAGLNRVNISLDSVDPDNYSKITKGGELSNVVAGIDEAVRNGLTPVKLNSVILKGLNEDEVTEIARFGLERGCEVRFLELIPIGPMAKDFDDKFVSSLDVREELMKAFLLSEQKREMISSSRNYYADDGNGLRGTVGFISSSSLPFCAGCTRLRLTSTGELMGCLGRSESINIKPILRRGNGNPVDNVALADALKRTLAVKHNERRFVTQSSMVKVGG
ncbi:MAG: GTP 3',8-cyclase MoaA [bacterium]|nr:GTP 3',8-cyclase MoaA [bacterium]